VGRVATTGRLGGDASALASGEQKVAIAERTLFGAAGRKGRLSGLTIG